MRSDKLEIGPPDFFVELEVGRAAPAAMLGVLMKNSAHEKRVIPDVRPQKKTLFGRGAGQSDQHVGKILAAGILLGVRRAKSIGARESLEQRADIIREFAVGDVGPF